ncbi:MAG TPA: hypothetical protein VKA53_07780, partial [Thermoanaerobaculia bacterium]|nr:hypothetical protein [Thermoanaerobaculia bacterium]
NGTPDQMCKRPIENVYWPTSEAPSGTYTLAVHAHALLPTETPLHFEVEILRGQDVVWRRKGVLVKQAQTFGPFEFHYPDRLTPKLASNGRQSDWCGAKAF